MYPKTFEYYRAGSVDEAVSLLEEGNGNIHLLAGGQSLIPLLKLRVSQPDALIDMNFIDGLSYISLGDGLLELGAMTRHNDVATSDEIASRLPIIHDCASGIADEQIRNMGTIGGSIAEADPSGDWATVLLTLKTRLTCRGPDGERDLTLDEFLEDAFTTALGPSEVITEVTVELPPEPSGGAFLAFKRSAQVYATASVAVRLTLENGICNEARVALGCVGLTNIRATEAEEELKGNTVQEDIVDRAAAATREAANPQPDQRGSVDYKKDLVYSLTRKAIRFAHRRSQGQDVEVGHLYALKD